MPNAATAGGRAAFGAAALIATSVVVACATELPAPVATPFPSAPAASVPPTTSRTPRPSSPATFAFESVKGTFPAVTSLTSTGERLSWASEGSIWEYSPGNASAEEIYVAADAGALVWDIAASGDSTAFSESMERPAGAWRVLLIPGGGEPPILVDQGRAERGRPPTLAVDNRRVAWAGFDEAGGQPRSFLKVVDRAALGTPTTLLDVDVDQRLLWYPALDRETLWYSTIDPDFEGTGAGDRFHIETMDLTNTAGGPVAFEGAGLDFEAAVSEAFVAWKTVEAGFSALSWGELHVLDRRSNDRLVIPGQWDHPTLGSRFVAFEELFHERLALYDLATRALIDVADPPHGSRGTVGVPTIGGRLFAYSVFARGRNTVYWTILPN